ncbi:MAG: hypothetical protein D3914_17120, partial [Candidatus Electrothrix sp. LOE2]|nr:hypothetical protein [Candidatus Electrothrix sp. LOE2]
KQGRATGRAARQIVGEITARQPHTERAFSAFPGSLFDLFQIARASYFAALNDAAGDVFDGCMHGILT